MKQAIELDMFLTQIGQHLHGLARRNMPGSREGANARRLLRAFKFYEADLRDLAKQHKEAGSEKASKAAEEAKLPKQDMKIALPF